MVVVDAFEVIEVDHQDRKRRLIRERTLHFDLKNFLHVAVAEGSREPVGNGFQVELLDAGVEEFRRHRLVKIADASISAHADDVTEGALLPQYMGPEVVHHDIWLRRKNR